MLAQIALALTCAAIAGGSAAAAQSLSRAELERRAEYRRPPPQPAGNSALIALGRELFVSPLLSASGKTSCASCHFPELGWATTEARSRNDSGKLTSRKSQPLIGIGHAASAPVGWDGRSLTLEEQAKASIATGSMSMRETDAPVKVEVIEERIRADRDLTAMFAAALPNVSVDIDSVATAIAAFERALEPGLAAFDRWVEGDESAISEAAKRGFALFNGKANCFACHTGWRFTDDRFHDIGTTTTDRGRGRVDKDELMQFAFKTPTLRSVAVRPPYMHNGSLPSLTDVVRHYEKAGIDRPSRSPLMQPIELTSDERQDLVDFMATLTGEDQAIR